MGIFLSTVMMELVAAERIAQKVVVVDLADLYLLKLLVFQDLEL